MPKLVVSKKTAVEDYGLPFDGDKENGVVIISKKICDQTRWSCVYELIVRIKDKAYRTFYSVGATEMQDESPWEYEDEVTLYEVREVEKTVKAWEDVPEDGKDGSVNTQ